MTDNEIIKVLECCKDIGGCFVCPLYTTDGNRCTETVIVAALDLIQRQQERMDKIVEQLEKASPQPSAKIYAHENEYTAAFEMHEKCIEIVKGVQNE